MFRFSREDRQAHSNSHTFYLGYEGPLPATTAGKEVKVDITIREKLIFPVERRPVLRGYAEYADLPENTALRVYSLDEIEVEKAVAVMNRARNEPRDLYDIWYLAEEAHVDLGRLKSAVEEKLGFRGKKLDDVRGELAAKEARFKKLWQTRLAAQMASLPEFDEVYRAVRRSFRQAGLS
ncbi:MAG: nucleotidyl transferase AbiEii/AbiGii toxin family protein [Elusimicrobia bacterium]|nr:nucleotidyl transferase AbiEii/AbiGii toxin family protein [Elusimicrobiota bacterium]